MRLTTCLLLLTSTAAITVPRGGARKLAVRASVTDLTQQQAEMPPPKKTEGHRGVPQRPALHDPEHRICVLIASVYENKDAFGKACVHTAADVTGPQTWRARYLGHDKHAVLFRQRFLSAGTKGIRRTLLMAASASVALGAVGGPVAGGSVVALAAARKLAARLEARGLFSPEGENHRGPVLEKARKRWGASTRT